MSPRNLNVIVFGAPDIDRCSFIQLAGVETDSESVPRPVVFETRKYTVDISQQHYTLYDTTGLSDSDQPVDAQKALSMLHRFTRLLDGPINLLVYVVHDKPAENNYRLFCEYLCGGEVPVILFQKDPTATRPIDPPFKLAKVFRHNDRWDTIYSICNKKAKPTPPMELFMKTTIASWLLLEKAAGWTLPVCRDAFKRTLIKDGSFTEAEAERACQNVTELIKK